MTTYNLADLFELIVDRVPEREAIVTDDQRISYAKLEDRANRLANYLRAQGVKAGDHIGIHLRNGNEYIEGMLAAYKLSAVPININYNYVESELRFLYGDTDLVALLVHREYAPRVANVAEELPKLKIFVVVEDGSCAEVPTAWDEYEATLNASSAQRDFGPRSSDDVYIICTGGTTGMPKGVMWRHEDIFFASLGGGDPDRTKGFIKHPDELAERIPDFSMATLAAPPFMHAAAQWGALTQMLSGGTLVIPAKGAFDVQAIWRAVCDENVVALLIVGDAMGTPLADELEANPDAYDPQSLFVIASGGAILSPVVKKRLLKLLPGKMILDGLGSSETGVIGNKTSDGSAEESTEARFMVGEAVQVLDDDLQPIAAGSGKVGLLARGGHVPLGYYNAPEKTAKTFVEANGQRWSLPGDMATVEEDGSVLLLGRGSTSINTGGEKVFPEEVESALKENPKIYDAIVVGVPDERFGQAITAVVQLRPGVELLHAEMKEACRANIAGYKIPRQLVLCNKIKRSPAGKADYPWAKEFALRALGLT
ncbi:MAG: acyl-CoA synthetase [Pseudomonadales bacterium]